MAKLPRPTRPLADVNVLPRPDGGHEVVCCFLPDPAVLVGEHDARAFLALDASASLMEFYGLGGIFGANPNYVERGARELGATLAVAGKAGRVDGLYWALGPNGDRLEPFGSFDVAGWASAAVTGPQREPWGRQTRLLPVLRHAADLAVGAEMTVGVVVTDGRIDDEEECLAFSLELGRKMEGRRPQPLKLALVGLGPEVDRAQLARFDDLFEGSGIDFDLWSHGLAVHLQRREDVIAVVFGELMTDKPVARAGWVEDDTGRLLARWGDGLPGKFRFVLPAGRARFLVRTVGPDSRIEQDVSSVLAVRPAEAALRVWVPVAPGQE
jgi:hypothetical protein